MAELIIQTEKIKSNIKSLSAFFLEHDIQWSLITKVFSGDLAFLQHVLTDDVIENIYSVGDSRLTSLKNLKEVNPQMRTIYIKPPAIIYADEVVRYADVSLNSSLSTIKALNAAAKSQGKLHQVIIMIELGELREGITPDKIVAFYERAFELSNIEVVGIGSNLGCMYGVAPTYEKLLQLSLHKEKLSAKFNKHLPLISGGSSITLPLLADGTVPPEINHFRVGEAAFFGITPLDNKQVLGLHTDTFTLKGNIIELAIKNVVPDGIISDASVGVTAEVGDAATDETSVKAILDFGMLDVDKENIDPKDPEITFVGITSDMIVVNLGDNKTEAGQPKYRVGDTIDFSVNYMAVARLLNSKFIAKVFEPSLS